MQSPQKEKKLFDIWKHIRRIKYRVKNFFQYRLMASSKHLLLVGDKSHPLSQHIYKEFSERWRIVHMGYFNDNDPVKELLSINLNLVQDQNGHITQTAVKEIHEKLNQFSKHFETIVVLNSKISNEQDIVVTGDIDSFNIHQNDIRQALIASQLATRILYTNGLLIFTASENSFVEQQPKIQQSTQQLIKDCQIQHLGLVLGERDDLENDTLVLNLLLKDELSTEMQNAVIKFIRIWSDGLKRPASGTFVKFKQSEHKKPIIFPEIF